MPESFTLSRSRVVREWNRETQSPLDVLHPHEAKAAELYASLWHNPLVPKQSRGPEANRINWGTVFRETFGVELTSKIKKGLHQNPAWTTYLRMLQTQTRDAVLAKLERDAFGAYEDYSEARSMAKVAGDYKELRLGAADHLDRIGATLKPTTQSQANVVIVLKSRNFEEAPMKKLPPVDSEIVVEDVPK